MLVCKLVSGSNRMNGLSKHQQEKTKWGREHGHVRQVKGTVGKVEPRCQNSQKTVLLGQLSMAFAGGGTLGLEPGGKEGGWAILTGSVQAGQN